MATPLPDRPAAALLVALAWACGSAGPDRVVVTQPATNTVALFDGATGALQARIEVGMLPHNVVVSADGTTAWTALAGSQAVAEIDLRRGRLARTFLTAPVPERRADGSVIAGHAAEGAFARTTCYDCHRPDGVQPKVVGRRPVALLLSRDQRSLWVAHLRTGDLAQIDLASGAVERTVALAPSGAASEPAALERLGGEIWVALRPPQPSNLPGALRRLDEALLQPLGEAKTGSDPAALLAVPGRGQVLVSNFETDTVTVHDSKGGATPLRVSPGPLGLLALPGGGVLALDYYSNALSLVDLDAGTAETLPLQRDGVPYSNPTQAALASDGRSAWIVASGTDGHLLQFDLPARRVVRDVAIDGLSFGVAVAKAAH